MASLRRPVAAAGPDALGRRAGAAASVDSLV